MATSISLPPGWRMDYDHEASRCFFVCESTSFRQWEFPKPGDELKGTKAEAKAEVEVSGPQKPSQQDSSSGLKQAQQGSALPSHTEQHVQAVPIATKPLESESSRVSQDGHDHKSNPKNEPAKADKPGATKTESLDAEPAKTQAVEAQVIKPEPTKAEPAKAEPAKAENVNLEHANVKPVKTELTTVAPVQTENIKEEKTTKPVVSSPTPVPEVTEGGAQPAEDSATADSNTQEVASEEADAEQASLKGKKWKTSKWASKALKKTATKTGTLANKSMPVISSAAKKTGSMMATAANKSSTAMKGAINSPAVKFVGAAVGDTVTEIAGRHFGITGASSLVNSGISKISTINEEVKTKGIGAVSNDLIAISTEIADAEQMLVAEVQNRMNEQNQSGNQPERLEEKKADTLVEPQTTENEASNAVAADRVQINPPSSTQMQSLALLQALSSATNTRVQSTTVQPQLSQEAIMLLGQQVNETAQSINLNTTIEAALSTATTAEAEVINRKDAAADMLTAVSAELVNTVQEDFKSIQSAVGETAANDAPIAETNKVVPPLISTGQQLGEVVLTPQSLQSISPITPASETGSYFVLPPGVQIVRQGNQLILLNVNPSPPASPIGAEKANVSISEVSMAGTPIAGIQKAMTLPVGVNTTSPVLAGIERANTLPVETTAESTTASDTKENSDSASPKKDSSAASKGLKKVFVNLAAPTIMALLTLLEVEWPLELVVLFRESRAPSRQYSKP